jgi:hypothetical protein
MLLLPRAGRAPRATAPRGEGRRTSGTCEPPRARARSRGEGHGRRRRRARSEPRVIDRPARADGRLRSQRRTLAERGRHAGTRTIAAAPNPAPADSTGRAFAPITARAATSAPGPYTPHLPPARSPAPTAAAATPTGRIHLVAHLRGAGGGPWHRGGGGPSARSRPGDPDRGARERVAPARGGRHVQRVSAREPRVEPGARTRRAGLRTERATYAAVSIGKSEERAVGATQLRGRIGRVAPRIGRLPCRAAVNPAGRRPAGRRGRRTASGSHHPGEAAPRPPGYAPRHRSEVRPALVVGTSS